MRTPVVVVVATLALAASGTAAAKQSSLVGRWQANRTCQGLVAALQKAGLARLAPGVVGDYFPNQQPAQLANKKNLCSGAKPQSHSHFFTADGTFGSLDQSGKQVDDGKYHLVGAGLVKINDGLFRFRIQGQALTLTPMLTAAEKRAALAKPFNFSTAGWMVAVSNGGHPWKRGSCGTWC